jgi:poly(3-hydroxybutyrate) depolymerase
LSSLPEGQFPGDVANVTIMSSGLQRNYLISIPPSYSADLPSPLIVSYHGGVRTAEDQLQLDQLTNVEFNDYSFVVYPQGISVSEKRKLNSSRVQKQLTQGRTHGKASLE